MPVTLAQAKLNTTDDIDIQVINEFQKQGWLVSNLPFHDVVNGAGAGGTLTYGYQRQITQATAGFRALNAEYTPQEVTKQRFTTDLKPLGGSFQIDRVLDRMAAAAETEFQMQNKVAGASAAFNDAVINGDTAVDANGFDGLSKALTGSSTELGATTGTDWTTIAAGNDSSFAALDAVDELIHLLNGPATALLGNSKALSKLRAVARRANMYTSSPVVINENDPNGSILVEQFGNVVLVDMGTKAGTSDDVIPVTNKTVNTVTGNYTDLYAIRLGLDAFHGVSMAGAPLINTWLPDFSTAGAVKTGEVELGPVSVALKATKGAAVLRNIRVS
jgi:hypothetical protein